MRVSALRDHRSFAASVLSEVKQLTDNKIEACYVSGGSDACRPAVGIPNATTRVHHTPWRRGGGVADVGERPAAAGTGGGISRRRLI